MKMTIDDFETKALQVLLSQRFLDFPLFEEEELSNYEVADIQGSMPFDDFIRQYAEIIMEQVKATYENRLKADMVAMLTDMLIDVEEIASREQWCDYANDNCISRYDVEDLFQQKINALKADTEGQDGQTSN